MEYAGALADPDPAIPYRYLALYKSLVGDPTDGYPGVPGFGRAAFDELGAVYGADVYDDLIECSEAQVFDDLEHTLRSQPSRALELIFAAINPPKGPSWPTMWALARLHPELCAPRPGRPPPEALVIEKAPPDRARVFEVLKNARCEDAWERLLPHLNREGLVTSEHPDRLAFLKRTLAKSPILAFDFETTDAKGFANFKEVDSGYVDVLSQSIVGMGITFGPNLQWTLYLSFGHRDTANLDRSVLTEVLNLLVSTGRPLVAHHAPFEWVVSLLDLGVRLPWLHDTRVMASHVDENRDLGLKSLSAHYLGVQQASFEETLGERAGMHELSGEEVLQYGCDDARCTAALYDLFWLRLLLEGTWDFVREFEFAMVESLGLQVIEGQCIDFERLAALQKADERARPALLETVRARLLEHCAAGSNVLGAERLFAELGRFTEASLKAAGKDEAAITTRLARLRSTIVAGSQYVAPHTIPADVTFKPTAKQIKAVMTKLGFPEALPFERIFQG